MSDFYTVLRSPCRLLFDGAMGTELQQRGLTPGMSPEEFCLSNLDVLEGVHLDYCIAGADVLTTNTFGGTRCKLPSGINAYEFNKSMAQAAKAAVEKSGKKVFVAGSIGPTGNFLRPLGDMPFDEMVAVFQEQVRGLVAGGVDLLIAETQFDIAEARAIVIAIRKETRLPIAVSMTYEEGVTLTGSDVQVCVATLANMGVDIIATNCSAGPIEMQQAVATLLATSPVPVLVQPNAGLPQLDGDRTWFPLNPEDFSQLTANFAQSGAKAVGGCCGTSPAHIKALRAKLDALPPYSQPYVAPALTVTSRSSLVRMGQGHPLCVIGERINPTGKKLLSAELQAGEFSLALQFAQEQIAAGATILDVNVGAPMVDEVALLPELATKLFTGYSTPLSLDSSNPAAIEAALAMYPASALVNSISGEHGRMERLGPLCRDYGAPFVLLPLQGSKLPVLAKERIAIVESLLTQMDELNIPRSLAVVDILALSVSSSAEAVKECLTFIRYCREVLHLPTVCGLSNTSFGLPARDLVNSHFLSLAVGAGLNACIANPSSPRLAEAVDALYLLHGHDVAAEQFIGKYAGWKHEGGQVVTEGKATNTSSGALTLEDSVVLGRIDSVIGLVQAALDEGQDPFAIVGERLIPAITIVGSKYERKEYFLPQLIRSAEAMQKAFALLRPLLEKDSRTVQRPVIVVATVEGDIHDIGKNIVSLLLGNHGFEVVDLGKDVAATEIVAAAQKHNAALIGLSALMTTTMVRMQDTVTLLQQNNMPQKVIVGGAVVTDEFAKSIGAHHAKDAVDAVRLAQEILQA